MSYFPRTSSPFAVVKRSFSDVLRIAADPCAALSAQHLQPPTRPHYLIWVRGVERAQCHTLALQARAADMVVDRHRRRHGFDFAEE